MHIAKLTPALSPEQVEQFLARWEEEAPPDHGLTFEFNENADRVTVTSQRHGIPTNWDPADLQRTFAIAMHRAIPAAQIDWER